MQTAGSVPNDFTRRRRPSAYLTGKRSASAGLCVTTNEDRLSPPVEFEEKGGDASADAAIEVAGRFVAEEQQGLRISARARAAR